MQKYCFPVYFLIGRGQKEKVTYFRKQVAYSQPVLALKL